METKYKGYEDLLDVDEDDPDIVIPHDVQGSVRALKYALQHPLIISEPHGTYKERRVRKTKVSYPSTARGRFIQYKLLRMQHIIVANHNGHTLGFHT